MQTVVAITHVPFEDLGCLAQVPGGLRLHRSQRGRLHRGFAQPRSAHSRSAGCHGWTDQRYQTDVYPFLAWELDLLRRRL